ncbi:MAG: hypothetical protein AAF206_05370 [Bacteroidota bacterium]
MKATTALLFTLLGILMVYASEMPFMPHYLSRPDKWHLLLSMLVFGLLLCGQLIWQVVLMVKHKKMDWTYGGLMVFVLLGFAQLNHPKGNWQEVGYAGLGIIALIISLRHAFDSLKKENKESDLNR